MYDLLSRSWVLGEKMKSVVKTADHGDVFEVFVVGFGADIAELVQSYIHIPSFFLET